MLDVADIVRRHGAAVRTVLGTRLLPSQARALRDLAACRTAACGGQLTQCTACVRQVYRYHSCRNRHCPKCGGDQAARWLTRHHARLLPCPHYLITVTLPAALRPLAFGHQAVIYGALLRCAAAALQTLAADPRYVGTSLGCLAVLHTWTRDLRYHPHVHLIVTAGGLSADRTRWVAPKHPAFLVPVRALSVLVRAKMCAAVTQAGLLEQVPAAVWTTPWVVHAQPAGDGARVLDYLARYLFRVAISNSRLEQIDEAQVTFRYRHTRTQTMRRVTLSGVEFLRRFLQHVLPRRCAKVRYYGLWSATRRADREHARTLLDRARAATTTATAVSATPTASSAVAPVCPLCHAGTLTVIALLRPLPRKVPP
ncbi:MAG: IS91 family transposase [Gemmatimonadetes bacterium]|nr:IS91 family transposase [Gemmatimonadota bacterium]